MRSNPGAPLWQRNYYEHIIRDDEELAQVREYVAGNSLSWEEGKENPDKIVRV
jgi:REP element-mobilizing transposase RayT